MTTTNLPAVRDRAVAEPAPEPAPPTVHYAKRRTAMHVAAVTAGASAFAGAALRAAGDTSDLSMWLFTAAGIAVLIVLLQLADLWREGRGWLDTEPVEEQQ